MSNNFSYLVIDEKNRDACIIDPSESSSVIKFLENKKINLKFILNTHHHADHVDGNIELKNKYKAKVIGFIDDKFVVNPTITEIKNSKFALKILYNA